MGSKYKQTKYKRFLEWLDEHDFKNYHQLQIKLFPDMGAGVVAPERKDYENDRCEYVLTIPPSLLICASKLRILDPETYGKIFDEDLVMILFLILERKKACDSVWFPYLNILQINYVPPYEWENIPEYILELPKIFQNDLISSNKKMFRLYGEIQKIFKKSDEFISLELFRWAYTNYTMRALYLEKPPILQDYFPDAPSKESYMIPFADCFNHHHDGDGETVLEDDGSCRFEINGPSSGQLFVNYNQDLSNADFYITYGFSNIIPNSLHYSPTRLSVVASPNDRIEVSQKKLLNFLSQFKFLKENLDVLGTLDLFLDTSFYFRWSDDLCEKRITFEQTSKNDPLKATIALRKTLLRLSIPSERVQFLSPTLDAFFQILCLQKISSPIKLCDLFHLAIERLNTKSRCDFISCLSEEEIELYLSFVDIIFMNIHSLCPDLLSLKDRIPINLPDLYPLIHVVPSGDMQNIVANHYALYLFIANQSFQFNHTTHNLKKYL